ncbi:MAG TPA: protein phosphatase CheZ [Candidatus Cybelea sp.]|nr:protein phosphatase CheZ [Candidatus Cybelea sp.]
MAGAVPAELVAKLSALKTRMPSYTKDEIEDVVSQMLASMEGDLSEINLKLYAEVESLARYIVAAKSEIAALRPDEIMSTHLPSATDELDAIVGSTEEATNGILQAMEALETLAGEMPPEMAEKVTDAVTKVYEACNFQDITGQRITKVVKALKHIESKVDALVSAFGDEIAKYKAAHPQAEKAEPKSEDATLLNGPQLPENASKQDDIDALLASFD